jgi:hypothetical protein
MAQRNQFSTPVVGRGTGFHGNSACRQLSKELAHMVASERGTGFHGNSACRKLSKELAELVASEHSFLNLFVVLIQTDDVKNVLCQVQAYSGNIYCGLLSHSVDGW